MQTLGRFIPVTPVPLAMAAISLAMFGSAAFAVSPGWAWILPVTLLSTGTACMTVGPLESEDIRDDIVASGREIAVLGVLSIPLALGLNVLASMLADQA